MSAARYTFYASALAEEVTVLLTLPDTPAEAARPAALFFSPKGREADYWLRGCPLERFGRPPYAAATLSLPGRLLVCAPDTLAAFLLAELPALERLFRLSVCLIALADTPDARMIQALTQLGIPVECGMASPMALLERFSGQSQGREA